MAPLAKQWASGSATTGGEEIEANPAEEDIAEEGEVGGENEPEEQQTGFKHSNSSLKVCQLLKNYLDQISHPKIVKRKKRRRRGLSQRTPRDPVLGHHARGELERDVPPGQSEQELRASRGRKQRRLRPPRKEKYQGARILEKPESR